MAKLAGLEHQKAFKSQRGATNSFEKGNVNDNERDDNIDKEVKIFNQFCISIMLTWNKVPVNI